MTSLKPIIIHSHQGGPNPWKVAILLNELNLPHKHEYEDFQKLHEPPFTNLNPNGRVPAIVDPNTGLTLWESGAILEYLQETYDKENQFGLDGSDRFLVKQWLHFQVSGQGPYFGQAVWFQKYHPEKIESAVQRYKNEILRVLGVLDVALKGKTYLVGEKYTIADLAFMPWDNAIPMIFGDEYPKVKVEIESKFPNYSAWRERIRERPAVKKTFEERAASLASM